MNTIELIQAHDGTWLARVESLADRVDDWNRLKKAFNNINKGADKND